MSKQTIHITVNGRPVVKEVSTGQLLLDFLRDDLGLTGCKEACSVGVCGLCTGIADGMTISTCLLPAVCVDGKNLYTPEGLADLKSQEGALPEGAPNPDLWQIVQDSFLECEGLQCGICTPGQVMSAVSLLSENPHPSEEEIRHFMAGNLCRCTGYQ